MASSYSENVKSRMIQRMSGPNGVSARALAIEVGIHQTTLSQWSRDSARLAAMKRRQESDKQVSQPSAATIRQRRPEDWSPIEKLQAVMEASQVSEAGLGQWLRSKGLHEAQLRQWQDIVTVAAKEALAGGKPKGSSAEGKRVKELERELNRKDKALAETAALLVLRKKRTLCGGTRTPPWGRGTPSSPRVD